MALQRCSSCGKYITFEGREIPDNAIAGRVKTTKAKMRTLTAQINSELYEKLESLVERETDGKDSSKLMSEIVALGLKQYDATLSQA